MCTRVLIESGIVRFVIYLIKEGFFLFLLSGNFLLNVWELFDNYDRTKMRRLHYIIKLKIDIHFIMVTKFINQYLKIHEYLLEK